MPAKSKWPKAHLVPSLETNHPRCRNQNSLANLLIKRTTPRPAEEYGDKKQQHDERKSAAATPSISTGRRRGTSHLANDKSVGTTTLSYGFHRSTEMNIDFLIQIASSFREILVVMSVLGPACISASGQPSPDSNYTVLFRELIQEWKVIVRAGVVNDFIRF